MVKLDERKLSNSLRFCLILASLFIILAAIIAMAIASSTNSRGVYVDDYGAKGDGVTDDTAAIQAAFSSNATVVSFRPGATYDVTNLIMPDTPNRIYSFNNAILNRISGGSTDYVIAAYAYVNNFNSAGQPLQIKDMIVNGNSIATNGLVIENWDSVVYGCEIYHCVNGIKATTMGVNGGSLVCNSCVNNKYILNKLHNNTGHGFWIQDSSQNKLTDYFLQDNLMYCNPINAYVDTCAGSLITGNHFYNGRSGDLYIAIASFGLRITVYVRTTKRYSG
jgi:parallel beta-helix repeat protein